ncbi:MAG: DUF4349 domain-containing protein [Eubacteriales bacterium]
MKKRILIMIMALIMLTGMVGCAAKSSQDTVANDVSFYSEEVVYNKNDRVTTDSDEIYLEAEEAVAEMPAAEPNYDDGSGGFSDNMDAETVAESSDRKLIYRSYYQMETIAFDADYALIIDAMNKVGGYPQNSWVNGTKPEEYGDSGRYAELTLRIPISKYESFISSLEGIGNILSKSQSTDDVSAQYFDTESRIRVLNTQLERLEVLLAQAENMEDIIILDQKISDVLYQLDSYEGQLRQLDNLIDYTTVTVTLNEVNEITTITEGELGLGQKIVKGFKNVGKAVIRFFEGLLIAIVGGAPAWVPIGLVTWLVVWLIKRKKAKSADKK